ncbi:MAG: hypothetical protein PWQ09_1797 [Candidatus Cloacimonadota bacterium]|jgi:lipopolysaccharide assembly outer membrane protein LptD (OstA)|nr:hypothetical protein [Candidatus Cloacimonadota bacterium]
MKSKLTISIGSFLLLFSWLWPQQELRPYKLINADTLLVQKVAEEYVTTLSGNVHLFYGETEFFTEQAELFEKQKISRMLGNVEVYDDTLSLYADKVEYFRKQEKLALQGDVFVRENHADSTYRTFESERAEYWREKREFYADENVKFYDQREEFHGSCGDLNYFLERNYGYLLQKPVLKVVQADSLQISAEKIEYFEDFKKIVATFNVQTIANDFIINSNFLIYFDDEKKAHFVGQPSFESDFADAWAQEFRVYFQKNKIKKAELQDSCFVKFRTENDKEKLNWIRSDFMELHFQDRKIRLCEAESNVTSKFLQTATAERDFMKNRAAGENLLLYISPENKLEKIELKKNVKGKYTFEP